MTLYIVIDESCSYKIKSYYGGTGSRFFTTPHPSCRLATFVSGPRAVFLTFCLKTQSARREWHSESRVTESERPGEGAARLSRVSAQRRTGEGTGGSPPLPRLRDALRWSPLVRCRGNQISVYLRCALRCAPTGSTLPTAVRALLALASAVDTSACCVLAASARRARLRPRWRRARAPRAERDGSRTLTFLSYPCWVARCPVSRGSRASRP